MLPASILAWVLADSKPCWLWMSPLLTANVLAEILPNWLSSNKPLVSMLSTPLECTLPPALSKPWTLMLLLACDSNVPLRLFNWPVVAVSSNVSPDSTPCWLSTLPALTANALAAETWPCWLLNACVAVRLTVSLADATLPLLLSKEPVLTVNASLALIKPCWLINACATVAFSWPEVTTWPALLLKVLALKLVLPPATNWPWLLSNASVTAMLKDFWLNHWPSVLLTLCALTVLLLALMWPLWLLKPLLEVHSKSLTETTPCWFVNWPLPLNWVVPLARISPCELFSAPVTTNLPAWAGVVGVVGVLGVVVLPALPALVPPVLLPPVWPLGVYTEAAWSNLAPITPSWFNKPAPTSILKSPKPFCWMRPAWLLKLPVCITMRLASITPWLLFQWLLLVYKLPAAWMLPLLLTCLALNTISCWAATLPLWMTSPLTLRFKLPLLRMSPLLFNSEALMATSPAAWMRPWSLLMLGWVLLSEPMLNTPLLLMTPSVLLRLSRTVNGKSWPLTIWPWLLLRLSALMRNCSAWIPVSWALVRWLLSCWTFKSACWA